MTPIDINIHELRGNEFGYEASTVNLKNGRGFYYVASGETLLGAQRELAMKISEETGQRVRVEDLRICRR